MRILVPLAGFSLCLISAACSSDDARSADGGGGAGGSAGTGSGGDGPGTCSPFEELVDGACINPVGRYEPEERVDFDNVVSYSNEALALDLPEPPKSGFRLVVPPQAIPPGEEIQGCVAWEYPADLTNRNVYAARLYTTGMLHHSNMYGVPIGDAGPSAYPECAEGQSNVFSQVVKALDGIFMDVLFANSTQVTEQEALVFPEGMAYQIQTENREVVTSIHWLNTSSQEFVSEVVYDFYTMPDDEVVETLVPFVFENQAFTIGPQTVDYITTTCDITAPGNIVSLMPHTHQRATNFTVDLLDASGEATRIYEAGAYDLESDIQIFDDPVSMGDYERIEHECTIDNELDQELVYGVGVNEMCTLFGYLYPPEAQQLGIIIGDSPDCSALHIGQYR